MFTSHGRHTRIRGTLVQGCLWPRLYACSTDHDSLVLSALTTSECLHRIVMIAALLDGPGPCYDE
jgi:hypothetical protein